MAFACLLAFASGATATQRGNARPLSAEIIGGRGCVAEQGHPGNVRVTLANGHRQMWTRKGNCELPRVSKSGLVGWTHGTAFHSKGALLNNTLVVVRAGKVLTRIRTFYSFIDVWDFADADSCVIVLSAGPHGPGRLEKFRIADGEFETFSTCPTPAERRVQGEWWRRAILLGGCYEGHTDEWPAWARRFMDKAREESTFVE